MRLIRLGASVEGMVLGQDIQTGRPHEAPLLRAGVRLSRPYINRLAAMGVHTIWVDDAVSYGIQPLPPLPPEARRAAETEVARSFQRTAGALATGRAAMPPEELDTITDVVRRIARTLSEAPEASLALNDLATADAYTHRHSVQVAIIGLLIARRHWYRHGWSDWAGRRRFDGIEARLTKLGVGLIVHDIGKLAVPREILQKPGHLTDAEMAEMHRHPRAGVDLLAPGRPSPLIVATVRDHHERLDGSGYPEGRDASRIHEFARICAIADVYDAMSSERPYKPAEPPHVAVNLIAGQAQAGMLDPLITESFRCVCPPFPLGTEVAIGDGLRGVVSDVDPDDAWMPTVRHADGDEIAERKLDLRHLDVTRSAAGSEAA
jgi:HD-GYP domain-containing protein (c-di-GMP phosphodiesterase class II)